MTDQTAESSPTIVAVQVFKTPDGKTFRTEQAALSHMNAGAYKDTLNAYCKSRSWVRGQETRARNLIADFLAWEDANPQ